MHPNDFFNYGNNMMNPNEKNELILKLVNQNNKLANQIEKNNDLIKKIIDNQFLEEQTYGDIYYLDLCKIEFFPNYKCNKINIIFEKTTGLTIAIYVRINASVKELLMAFFIKMQIIESNKSKKINDLKDYYFLFNGSRISLDEKRTISEYGFIANSKIVFGDNQDIRGGT